VDLVRRKVWVVRSMEILVLFVVNCEASRVLEIEGDREFRTCPSYHHHHHRDVDSSRCLEKSESSPVVSFYRFLTTQSFIFLA
jgi:hypothetical protein